MTLQPRTCLLCGKTVATHSDGDCHFHAGAPWRAFSTGAVARDPDMAYRDIYVWPCCGRHEPSELHAGGERPPRGGGCAFALAHMLTADVALVATDEWRVLAEAADQVFREAGLKISLVDLAEFHPQEMREADIVCFLLGGPHHETAMAATEALSAADPNKPVVIFSDPDRVDGWRLQASSAAGLAPDMMRDAIIRALRWSRRMADGWSPLIFLSYARADAGVLQGWLHQIAQMERPCWVDTHMLSPGVDWSSEIESGIEASEHFVMVLTENTPHPTYCWKELEIARRCDKPIVIAAFDGQADRVLTAPGEAERDWRRHMVDYPTVGAQPLRIPARVEMDGDRIVAVLLEIEEGAKDALHGFAPLDRRQGAADWVRFWLQEGFATLNLHPPPSSAQPVVHSGPAYGRRLDDSSPTLGERRQPAGLRTRWETPPSPVERLLGWVRGLFD